jgi:hypothetical protein
MDLGYEVGLAVTVVVKIKEKKTDRCDFCAKLRKQLLKQNKNLN